MRDSIKKNGYDRADQVHRISGFSVTNENLLRQEPDELIYVSGVLSDDDPTSDEGYLKMRSDLQ